MRFTLFLIAVSVSCASRHNRTEPEAGEAASQGTISAVQCLATKADSGPDRGAWKLHLCRVIESDKGRDLSTTYLTTVGEDPTPFSVHYKLPDTGVVYVAVGELQSFFAVEFDSEVSSRVRKAEYDSVDADEVGLRILTKYGIEVEERQFPLLPPR